MVTLDPNAMTTHHLREKNHRNSAISEHEEAKDAKRVIVVDPIDITIGDLLIGTVEVKDGVTNDKLKVNPDGSVDANITVKPSKFFENNKPIAASTTDSLFTVNAASDLKLKSIIVGGNGDAIFTLSINSVKVLTFRNNITRSQVIASLEGLEVLNTQAIDVNVTNLKNQSRTFECTIIYTD